MSKFRSELHIPVERDKVRFADRVETILSNSTKHHTSYAKEFYSPSRSSFNPGLHSRPFDRIMLNNLNSSTDFSDSDTCFEYMKRRFDERRRRLDEKVRRMRSDVFTLLPSEDEDLRCPSSSSSGLQMLTRPFSSNIETRADGSKQFVAHFDMSTFPPDSITVSIRHDELTIEAKVKAQGHGSSHMREFTRSMNLPYGADATLMKATLSVDQVLTVTCPLQPINKRFKTTHLVQSAPSDMTNVESSSQSKDGSSRTLRNLETTAITVTPIDSCSPAPSTSRSILHPTKPKFCLELLLDPEYSPAEIQIRTLNNRIYINARHEERGGNRTVVKEFAEKYNIPEDVNPEDLQAKFDAGVLYINSVS